MLHLSNVCILNVGEKEKSALGSWGNYSIPADNPYVDSNGSRPEIWALGFRNPWRCSFDSQRPSYFYCGDVGQVCPKKKKTKRAFTGSWSFILLSILALCMPVSRLVMINEY